MAVPFRRHFGRLFPKHLRPAIKSWLFSLESRRFHGRPHARLAFADSGETATLSINRSSAVLAQPFAGIATGWLREHPEDLLELESFLKLAGKADGVMFDVGAHVGIFATLFCRTSTHDAICFEPVPASQKWIEHTAELNGLQSRIRVVAAAVGNVVGTTTLHLDATTGFAQAQKYESTPAWSRDSIVVPTTTVDAARNELKKKIGLLKIDVEGFEAEVLDGATHTLRTDQPVVAMEIHNDYLTERGVSLSGMLSSLEEHGYSLMRLNGRRISARVAARTFLPRGHLLAVPTTQRRRHAHSLGAHST